MLIQSSGDTLGTIGGGLLEARVLDLAGAVVRENRSAVLAMELTASQGLAGDVMICGGRVEILAECIDGADPLWLDLLNRILQAEKDNEPCRLICSIQTTGRLDGFPEGQSSPVALGQQTETEKNREIRMWVQTGRGLCQGDRFFPGSLDTGQWAPERLTAKARLPAAMLIESHPIRYFIQTVSPMVHVVIVGAGHVGQALATLCHFVGFKTIIMDDRPEYASRERFPAADEIRGQVSLEDCFSGMTITENDYIVIVTRGHAYDRSVLVQSLRTPAGYIGMIASRTKRDAIYKSLLDDGMTPDAIGRVHSPIGLPIGAQTPEEIAVSIMAEMISVHSWKQKDLKPTRRTRKGLS
jgi:xanthine dehydrogenase accessory factor